MRTIQKATIPYYGQILSSMVLAHSSYCMLGFGEGRQLPMTTHAPCPACRLPGRLT